MKIDALSFSFAGDKYLGRSYQEMDCQAFVERCMRDCGLGMNLPGSNAWYREIMKNGWVGTPEECVKLFGSVPKGALLFILKQNGKEPAKYRRDGIGNASHIGIKTGRNDGAIHSSSSRGRVATSVFNDRTINGGWNRVGLYNKIDYGKTVNWFLEHSGIGPEPGTDEPGKTEEGDVMTAVVTSGNGNPVNLRKAASLDAALVERITVGTLVEILGTTTDKNGNEWNKVRAGGLTGWMMSEFLNAGGSGGDPGEDAPEDPDGGEQIALYFTAEELYALLPILESASQQIAGKIGRG